MYASGLQLIVEAAISLLLASILKHGPHGDDFEKEQRTSAQHFRCCRNHHAQTQEVLFAVFSCVLLPLLTEKRLQAYVKVKYEQSEVGSRV